jgi:hypothetical protein
LAAASGDLRTTDELRCSTSATQKFSITLLLYSTSPSLDAARRSLGGDAPSLRATSGDRGSKEFRYAATIRRSSCSGDQRDTRSRLILRTVEPRRTGHRHSSLTPLAATGVVVDVEGSRS